MFRLVSTEGRSLVRRRDEIEVRAVELLWDLSDYQLLATIPGIGPINAMTVPAEAGDLRRFRPTQDVVAVSGQIVHQSVGVDFLDGVDGIEGPRRRCPCGLADRHALGHPANGGESHQVGGYDPTREHCTQFAARAGRAGNVSRVISCSFAARG